MAPSHHPEIDQALEALLAAESRARQRIHEAQEEARRIQAAARAEVTRLQTRLRESTRAEIARRLEETRIRTLREKSLHLERFARDLASGLVFHEPVADAVVAASVQALLRGGGSPPTP